jgi:hypothetical protein
VSVLLAVLAVSVSIFKIELEVFDRFQIFLGEGGVTHDGDST